MNKPRIILVGAGGHARSCIDVIEQEARFVIAGLVGTAEEVGSTVLGHDVMGCDTELLELARATGRALIAIGQIRSAQLRESVFDRLEADGCELPVIVSPKGYVSRHASIGAGSIVMHGAIVNSGAVIGRNCIINSQALVEHDAVVGDHCHIATGAILNGGVKVGARSFVGSGSSIRQGIVVGERCLVGMGQRVVCDCPDGTNIPELRAG